MVMKLKNLVLYLLPVAMITFSIAAGRFLLLENTSQSLPTEQQILIETPTPTYFQEKKVSSEKLWDVIQSWRTSQNLSKYKTSQKLCDIAAIRLQEIKSDWSHDGIMSRSNYFFSITGARELGENLAKDLYDEHLLLQAWLDSPTHKKNLVSNYTYSCVQVGDNYAVHIFGNF
jgi:uncharacterized protein YkwD